MDVRDPGTGNWLRCNDDSVSDLGMHPGDRAARETRTRVVNPDRLQSCEAYMLIYTRRGGAAPAALPGLQPDLAALVLAAEAATPPPLPAPAQLPALALAAADMPTFAVTVHLLPQAAAKGKTAAKSRSSAPPAASDTAVLRVTDGYTLNSLLGFIWQYFDTPGRVADTGRRRSARLRRNGDVGQPWHSRRCHVARQRGRAGCAEGRAAAPVLRGGGGGGGRGVGWLCRHCAGGELGSLACVMLSFFACSHERALVFSPAARTTA